MKFQKTIIIFLMFIICFQNVLSNNLLLDFKNINSIQQNWIVPNNIESFGKLADGTNYNNVSNENLPNFNEFSSVYEISNNTFNYFIPYSWSWNTYTKDTRTFLNIGVGLNNTGGRSDYSDDEITLFQIGVADIDNNYFISKVFFMNDSYYINENSNFTLDVRKSNTGSVAQQTTYIYFMSDSDIVNKSIIILNSGVNENLKYTLNVNEGIIFNRIEIINIAHLTGGYTFNNLSFSNVNTLEENNLPFVNITYNNKICINSSDEIIYFPLNYSIYDDENDTIYYSMKSYNLNSENETIYFYEKFCNDLFGFIPLCTNNKNYDFLQNTYFKSNSCLIKDESYNSSNFNLISFEVFPNNFYGLELNSNCEKDDKTFYYDINTPTTNLNYLADLRNLDNNDSLNITLYDETFNNIITQINLFTDENNLIISYLNSSDELELIGNITKQTNTLIEFYDLNIYEDTYTFRVWNEGVMFPSIIGEFESYTIPILNESSVKYVAHSIDNNTNILLSGLQFRGTKQEFNFTNNQITNLTLNGIGNYYFNIYTTDSINKILNKYNDDEIFINVVNCNVYIESDNFMDSLIPTTNSESFNNFIFALRQPYLLFVELNFINEVYFALKMGIIFLMFKLYKKFAVDMEKAHEDIFRIIFIYVNIIVTILYVMFLIEKSWFITFSVLALLYLGYEIINITGTEESNEKIAYVVITFSILSYIWFGLFQIAFGVNMGLPIISNIINFNNPLTFITSFGNYLIQILFFSIPEIPTFLNLIVMFIRGIGILSLVSMIYDKLNPLN